VTDQPTAEDRYGMSASDATTLYDLRRQFGDAYHIPVPGTAGWRAWRLGNALWTLKADDAEELRMKLREDLVKWRKEDRQES
jgi:hypothetical protein